MFQAPTLERGTAGNIDQAIELLRQVTDRLERATSSVEQAQNQGSEGGDHGERHDDGAAG
jgi:hypothetical protein